MLKNQNVLRLKQFESVEKCANFILKFRTEQILKDAAKRIFACKIGFDTAENEIFKICQHQPSTPPAPALSHAYQSALAEFISISGTGIRVNP